MQLSDSQNLSQRSATWLQLMFGLAIICVESTQTMGARHTGMWLQHFVTHFHFQAQMSDVPEINHLLRKSGHFLGYGTLGVLFCRGWFALLVQRMGQVRSAWATRMRVHAACFAVLSTAMVASLDELHQSYLPGRGASIVDVLLDTCGAMLLTGCYCLLVYRRRRQLLARVEKMRARLQQHRLKENFLAALEVLDRDRRHICARVPEA